MTPACALVFAGFCVHSPYDRAVNVNSMVAVYDVAGNRLGVAQPEAVRRLGARIEAYQSDLIRPQDPTGLPKACSGKACVIYLKTCSDDGLACEWDWGSPSEQTPYVSTETVWIGATSASAMKAAVRAISVESWRQGRAPVPIPLAALDQPSSFAYARPCTATVQTDCVNMFDGRVPVATATREQRLRDGRRD
jgi:hypothetical protein